MTAEPAIRAVHPTHLVALRAFDSRPSCTEITAPSWPRVLDGDARLPLWSLLSHSMTHPAGYRRAWVHMDAAGIDGLVVGRVRCGGLVWDVRHLWVDRERDGVAVELLAWVCHQAAGRGARRVFLETSLGTWELQIARRAGFEQYTQATLHAGRHSGGGPATASDSARPRLRGDEQPLFQLYTAAVPAPVRAAEALTLEEWVALHKGSQRWTPGLLANRHQYVWEEGEILVAWMELVVGAKSQHVEWLVRPSHLGACDDLIAYGLAQASPKAPLYATCREYQEALRLGLERAGFELVTERAVFARQLAARVPERRLAVAARARPTLGG